MVHNKPKSQDMRQLSEWFSDNNMKPHAADGKQQRKFGLNSAQDDKMNPSGNGN